MKSSSLLSAAILVSFNLLPTNPEVMAQANPSKLIVIAHRGDHTAAPENTLQAFQDAINTGVDYVEVDVRSSRDGELVVMHDATIDRMTTAHGNVKDFDWPALRKLAVLDKEHPEFGTHHVPTLAEVLDACQGKIGIYLDFKDGDIVKTWQLIQSHNMEKRVVIYINRADQFAAWRATAPMVPLMVSLPDSIRSGSEYAKFHQAVNAQIIDGSYREYTPQLVRAINENGQAVWVDVQEKSENASLWSKVLALGVQGMQTDHPREVMRWREKKK